MTKGAARPFAAVDARLRKILGRFAKGGLKVSQDKPGMYVLAGPPTERSAGQEVWFGAVRTGKAYASYHLMPVYTFPDLLEGVSPALRKRMQGKSCFNFREVDDAVFRDLARLTGAGERRYREAGLLPGRARRG